MKYFIILTVSAVVAGFGQLFLKLSKADITSPYLYAGFLLYGLSAILWVYVLKFLPLSKVYPFTFVTFALVMILSALVLREKFGVLQFVGAVLIIGGVMLMAKS